MKLRQGTQRAQRFLRDDLWDPAIRSEAGSAKLLNRAYALMQFVVMTAEGFVRDQLLLRATALSYFTVLSLIPIIAIVVAIAAAIGMDTQFEEKIIESIAGGAPKAQALIIDLVRNTKFSALGGIGAGVLLVTTVMGISNIERAFNSIWGVTRARSFGRRFPDYLAILMVVPLLASGLSLATGLNSPWLVQTLLEFPVFDLLYNIGLKQLPWLVLSLSFALMFWFLPNTSVRFSSAALGGMVAAILVVSAQKAYLGYSVGVAKADVLFGAFAQLPLLFFWIYIFWAIVLFGAEVAYAHQHLASYRNEVKGAVAGPAEREAAGLRATVEIASDFRDSKPPATAEALSGLLCVPVRTVRDIAEALERAGILAERVTPDGEAYSLGRPAEHIRVADVLAALRGAREHNHEKNGDADEVIEGVLAELDSVVSAGPGGRTIAELLPAIPVADPDAKADPDATEDPHRDRRLGIV